MKEIQDVDVLSTIQWSYSRRRLTADSMDPVWVCLLNAWNAKIFGGNYLAQESAEFRHSARDLDGFVLVLERNVRWKSYSQFFHTNIGAVPPLKKEAAPYGLHQAPRISPPHGIAKDVADWFFKVFHMAARLLAMHKSAHNNTPNCCGGATYRPIWCGYTSSRSCTVRCTSLLLLLCCSCTLTLIYTTEFPSAVLIYAMPYAYASWVGTPDESSKEIVDIPCDCAGLAQIVAFAAPPLWASTGMIAGR